MASGRWRAMSSATPSWMTRRREGRGSRALVDSTPHSTSRAPPGPASTMPKPRTAVPGSMPSTFMSPVRSGFGLRQLRGVDVEVREYLGDVVELFERLDQPEHPIGVGTLHLDRVPGHHGQLGGIHDHLPL